MLGSQYPSDLTTFHSRNQPSLAFLYNLDILFNFYRSIQFGPSLMSYMHFFYLCFYLFICFICSFICDIDSYRI